MNLDRADRARERAEDALAGYRRLGDAGRRRTDPRRPRHGHLPRRPYRRGRRGLRPGGAAVRRLRGPAARRHAALDPRARAGVRRPSRGRAGGHVGRAARWRGTSMRPRDRPTRCGTGRRRCPRSGAPTRRKPTPGRRWRLRPRPGIGDGRRRLTGHSASHTRRPASSRRPRQRSRRRPRSPVSRSRCSRAGPQDAAHSSGSPPAGCAGVDALVARALAIGPPLGHYEARLGRGGAARGAGRPGSAGAGRRGARHRAEVRLRRRYRPPGRSSRRLA